MQTYTVARPHMGERFYAEGDEREADPRDVAHLVAKGVLREKAAEKPANKAARKPANKAG